MTMEIKFYREGDEYGEFSNFAAYPINLDGKTWPTSEHYFQAQKFEDKASQEEIRGSNSPMKAARLGRDRKKKLRSDWESVKDDVMRKAVRAKFQQHEELRTLLLSTDSAKLIEHTENDKYWADGGDGSGKNMLGVILMEVRKEFQNEPLF
jgi:N-glycosidase YbiA